MSFGFLTTLSIFGLLTLLALIRIPFWGNQLFMVALPASELPHLGVLLLLASALLAWDEGGLAGGPGLALLIGAGLILIGLSVLLVRALATRPTINAMLREQGMAPLDGRWWWVRPLLFPFPARPSSVVRQGPIYYGEDRRQTLDVYRRRGEQPCPVLVYFHGGGYSSGGNRREARALLHHLAARGWTCISANYRLRPKFGFNDHLDDARAALSWAHENSDIHGGDTNTVVVAGSSAGAHLTALCALTQDDTVPGRPRVDAAVSLYAYYGRYFGRGEDESEPSTAFALDAAKAPPFFIAHGDHDSFVPVEGARELRAHLAAGSRRAVWYAELPGGQHGFDAYASWRFTGIISALDKFLATV